MSLLNHIKVLTAANQEAAQMVERATSLANQLIGPSDEIEDKYTGGEYTDDTPISVQLGVALANLASYQTRISKQLARIGDAIGMDATKPVSFKASTLRPMPPKAPVTAPVTDRFS